MSALHARGTAETPGQIVINVDDHHVRAATQVNDRHTGGEVRVRWRGSYAYATAHLDTDDEPAIPLCRLGYLGLDDEWEFALYDPATDTYTDTALPDGSYTGTPQDALDCACRVHVADIPIPPPEPL